MGPLKQCPVSLQMTAAVKSDTVHEVYDIHHQRSVSLLYFSKPMIKLSAAKVMAACLNYTLYYFLHNQYWCFSGSSSGKEKL